MYSAESSNRNKTGSHWVPIAIMAFLFILGIGLFFALPYNNSASADSFTVDGDMPWFRIADGVLSFSEVYYDGSSELTVPSSIAGQQVLALSEGCFEDCSSLTAVFLPDTLQAIGADAFRDCTSLRGMEIPDSVRFIGKGAFSGCSSMEAVRLSSQIEVIGSEAFSGCKRLHYVFFLGLFEDWYELYGEFIAADTIVFCDDGSFHQSSATN